jgi:putative oxidoreductase
MSGSKSIVSVFAYGAVLGLDIPFANSGWFFTSSLKYLVDRESRTLEAHQEGGSMSERTKNIVAWVASVALFGLIGLPGLTKLTMSAEWVERFEGWGLPGSMVMVVGAMELIGAALLLVPKLAKWGGALLAMAMLGASGTHLLNGEGMRVPYSLALAAVAVGVALFRHRQQGE